MRTAARIRASRLRRGAKLSDHRPDNRSRCRDPACKRPRYRAGSGGDTPALTQSADEKVLRLLAAAGWIASRALVVPLRSAGNHALLVTVAASLVPHGMKILFNQTRPDRRTVLGHVHGTSFSGNRKDAFPCGHALHMARWHPRPARCRPAPPGDPSACGRPADAHSGHWLTGRATSWPDSRPERSSSRLSVRSFKGEPSCRYLRI
jgi:hypothetical protein